MPSAGRSRNPSPTHRFKPRIVSDDRGNPFDTHECSVCGLFVEAHFDDREILRLAAMRLAGMDHELALRLTEIADTR